MRLRSAAADELSFTLDFCSAPLGCRGGKQQAAAVSLSCWVSAVDLSAGQRPHTRPSLPGSVPRNDLAPAASPSAGLERRNHPGNGTMCREPARERNHPRRPERTSFLLRVGPAPWNHLLLSPVASGSSSSFPSILPAWPPLQRFRQWEPGWSQLQGPSSCLAPFTDELRGSGLNPTSWHVGVPAPARQRPPAAQLLIRSPFVPLRLTGLCVCVCVPASWHFPLPASVKRRLV